MPAKPIATPGELYAHAIALELEASERYVKLATRMAELGRDSVAAVFAMLAGFEAEHRETLERRTDGVALPRLAPGEFKWLDEGAPESVAHDVDLHLLTPEQALAVALDAEKRAQRFFRHVFRTATDPALRALAQEMAAEEGEHIALVEREMAHTPGPRTDSHATGAEPPPS